MAFKIDPEFKALIPRLSDEEFAGLKESILRDGCRDPLVVWIEEDILLDGHHRHEICTTAKPIRPYNTIGLTFPNRAEAMVWIIQNQFSRRNLNDFVRVELALRLEEAMKEAARQRVLAGRPSEAAGRVDDKLGIIADVSRDTVRKVKAIKESGDEETIAACRDDKIAIDAGFKRVKSRAEAQQFAARKATLDKEPLPLPTGPFRCIVADPPWDFVGPVPYPTQTVDEICAMGQRVQAVVHPEDGACLWLWCVNSGIPQALRIMEAWGFEYRTILTWDKVVSGMGEPLLNVTEHAILAVRGEMRFLQGRADQTTLLREQKVRVHSRKPDGFFKLVEALCLGPRLELFSRTPRDGWVVWGDESDEERKAG